MSESHYLPELPITGGVAPDGVDKPFWDGLQQEKLIVQRCNKCDTWQWGPECICNKCLSFDMGWEEIEATGTIYSWERIWHPSHPALADKVPYLVVLVELPQADNIRVVGNLMGDSQQDVQIGSKVKAYFGHHNDAEQPYTLLQWQPAD